MKSPLRILIIAALCCAALIGLVVREHMARAGGTEIKLAMQAIDPRALLMGHYVIVDLRETLGAAEACPAGLGQQETITWRDRNAEFDTWVALAPAGDHHRAVALAATREEALQSAPLAVRGHASCAKLERFTAENEDAPAPVAVIQTNVGIDRFYAEQRLAEHIDAELRDPNNVETARVFAIVSIGQDGRARLNGLEVAGERFTLELF